MHFGKEYSALLSSLPGELSAHAVNYRQLKKTINRLVDELEAIGLGPVLLQSLQESRETADTPAPVAQSESSFLEQVVQASPGAFPSKVAYELLLDDQSTIQSRIRIWIPATGTASLEGFSTSAPAVTDRRLLWNMTTEGAASSSEPWISVSSDSPDHDALPSSSDHANETPHQELIIPLAADLTFFDMLTSGLESLSSQTPSIRKDFVATLEDLSRQIARSARPSSARKRLSDSDLYTWRDIFTQYIESEVFESTAELDRGDRSYEESEARLQTFTRRIGASGIKLSKSGQGTLERFLQLNVYLLNVKKLYTANSEATRKILKKHAKRTSLPLFSVQTMQAMVPSIQDESSPLPHILVIAIADILLPVVPPLADYECLICMNIAFKPIRLDCGHFFCVRCLVKMQKARDDHCPLCRSLTVITADKRNVDHALTHLMLDFFPRETREKQRLNDEECAKEEAQELGLRSNDCIIQ